MTLRRGPISYPEPAIFRGRIESSGIIHNRKPEILAFFAILLHSFLYQLTTNQIHPDSWIIHRNNRHRMRAPIFSQSKICLHKMAHSKGHFYSVQTPAVKNFARSRQRLKSIRWPTRGNSCPLAFTAHAPTPGKCSSKFLY